MKVVVMGVGVVGCYFVGMLVWVGYEVVFVGWLQYVEVFNIKGLWLEVKIFDEIFFVKVSIDFVIVVGIDLVFFCVKFFDIEIVGV